MAMRPPVPVPTLSRRAKLVLGAIAVLLVLFTVIGTLTNVYVDYLWFDETDYTEVFWTELQARALLFAVAGVATGGLTALSVHLAYRFRPTFRPMSLEQQNLERYRQSLEPRRGLVLTAVGVVLGLFAGFTAQSSWETWLTYRNSTDFGQTDPQFGLDLSFFVFDYPFYRLALAFGFAIVILALIGALLTHYVFGGLRLQTPGQKMTAAARVQISVLLGLFVALKAVAYWLDRYGLVYSDRGDVFTGASYTDVNALLVPKTILVFVAAVCAIAFFANIVVRNFLLPAAALVLLLISSLVIGVAYPAIVQQFVVKPSANEREAPYIERAIEMTRQAYNLDDIEYVDYAQETTGAEVDPEVALAELRDDTETIPNARLLDPNVLADTFTARQQIRNVYGFPEKLDIDRYTIDGETRDYVVAVRELNSAGLSENQSSWINRHTVYTHGNGFVAAPANEVVAGTEGGEPNFTTGDLPTRGEIVPEQSRVYYGELIQDGGADVYSVVGAPEGASPREFDLPEGGSDDRQINNTYDGEGGVSVGSFFRQLTFAIYYRERNFLLSSAVNEQSKVMYVRNPRDRVEKAAPFLEVDGDPYPAVIDGRINWILDGYTTSDSYPYAEQMELGEAAADALTGTGTTALPDDTFNYIRNSVKATVDAYDGTVTLYEWDKDDPVLQTYMKAFPGVVEPREKMSDELVDHVRYPEDLFKVQRDILTRYHVDDPVDFYNQSDRWQIPDDPTQDVQENQPPYYILAQRPGDSTASFQLTSALNAFQRENLSAFVSASSDPESYGEMQVLRLPGNTPFRGPQQVQNSFTTNNQVRPDLTLFESENSNAVFGNLLTLPIGDAGLLYVEPLYVEGTGESGFPLLQRVLVNFGDRIGYGNTLAEALDQVFGPGAGQVATDSDGQPEEGDTGAEGTPTETPETTTPPAPAPDGGGAATPEMDAAVADINAALSALADAQRNGDFAGQGQALERLQTAVEAYQSAQAAAQGGD
ncbi:membrane protein [Blastococcus sp. TF02A-30]|nr:membrane protein [Blastococcus sp. TF02A-30]